MGWRVRHLQFLSIFLNLVSNCVVGSFGSRSSPDHDMVRSCGDMIRATTVLRGDIIKTKNWALYPWGMLFVGYESHFKHQEGSKREKEKEEYKRLLCPRAGPRGYGCGSLSSSHEGCVHVEVVISLCVVSGTAPFSCLGPSCDVGLLQSGLV